MTDICRLPLQFDPDRLQTDLAKINSDEWQHHFNTRDYEGHWSLVSLRSASGRSNDIFSHPSAENFQATPLLSRMTYMNEVLNAIQAELEVVRLMLLSPGSKIKEHCDPCMAIEDGVVRLHIPIETDEGVFFYLEEQQIQMAAGECWYLNFSKKHRIDHFGNRDRVHLVIDLKVNEWFLEQIRAAQAE